MRRNSRPCLRTLAAMMLCGALLTSMSISASDAERPRFTIDATLKPVTVSDNGRFSIEAKLLKKESTTAPAHGFTIKSASAVNAECAALPDALFGNSFE